MAALVGALLTAVLLLWIPRVPLLTLRYTHDSGYIDRLASNLVASRGFTNDALWLVFLHPPSLPMAYHNANPLYPLLMAVVSAATGVAPDVAGLALSAASAGAILWASALLARDQIGTGTVASIVVGVAVALYLPVASVGLLLLPDGVTTAFVLWAVYWFQRRDGYAAVAAAGVCFGLAWLTRSTALLVVPALFAYRCATLGWRRGLRDTLVLGAVAALVALPWLAHTARVWGSPLRSDASYSMLQEYLARTRFGGSEGRFWHSVTTPPSVGELLRSEPAAFIGHVLGDVPVTLRTTAAAYALGHGRFYASPVALACLTGLLAWGLTRVPRTRRAAAAALVLVAVTHLAVLNVRGRSIEFRYLAPVSALLALACAGATRGAWRAALGGAGRTRLLAGGAAAAGTVYLGMATARGVAAVAEANAPNAYNARLVSNARRLAALLPPGAPVVVGDSPYLFNVATARPSLSIPYADDSYLRGYMTRYRARHVVLSDDEVRFWRPGWLAANGRPPWLSVAARSGPYTLYQLVDE